ncbi:exo-alpha-sialidase [Streptomyces sp. WM6386]|uniref:exo-alpha-sialidase n=1 Tax=Streptomyces sp. WM6386 TaxID=1415558 RepID=UPI001F35F05B|nr:exo-alpha-sialidase [Streptomyces sp. WM6386]
MSAAVAVAACGAAGIDDGDSGGREARYKRAIEDPHPQPSDVIEAAGAPTGVVRADDGSLLLSYDLRNVEDDEGPAAFAWRIVGPDGRTVAEHAEHGNAEATRTTFKGVAGGFVRVPSGEGADGAYLLDVRGKRHKVVITDTPMRTRPGDILLSEPEPTLVYRTATRTVAPPAGVADDAILVAVDERGTVWSLAQFLTDEPNRVVRQRDGRTLGSRAVPYSDSGGILVAGGATAALSLTQSEDVRGLLVTTDDGEHWQTVRDGGIPWKTLKGGPVSLGLELLTDGRLLVGEEGGRYWLADDRTNRAFHELRTPAPFTSFAVDGTTLYGIADSTTATYGLVKGEGLWISHDGGREWRQYKQRR